MSYDIHEFELKIDGKENNNVLGRYKDGDGNTYLSNLEDGYLPLTKNRDYIMTEDIIKKVMKSFPNSKIFFRLDTEYGEVAFEAQDGKIKELKKNWS